MIIKNLCLCLAIGGTIISGTVWADELMDRAVQLSAYYDYTRVDVGRNMGIYSTDFTQCTSGGSGTIYPLQTGALLFISTCLIEGSTTLTPVYTFAGCANNTYETLRGNIALVRYQYPGDTYILEFYQNFCAPCPILTSNDGTTYPGQIASDLTQNAGAITDCRIPTNTAITDTTGTYVFTSDCQYIK